MMTMKNKTDKQIGEEMMFDKMVDAFIDQHMMTHCEEDYKLKKSLLLSAEFIFPINEMGESCLLITPLEHEIYPSALILCLYDKQEGKAHSEKLEMKVDHVSVIDEFMEFYPEDLISTTIDINSCSNPDCENHEGFIEEIEKLRKENGQPPCMFTMSFRTRTISFPIGLYSQALFLKLALNIWKQMEGMGEYTNEIEIVVRAMAEAEIAKKAKSN